MKHIILSVVILTSACKEKMENIRLCSDDFRSGWYYIFICKEGKKFSVSRDNCFYFDEKVVLLKESSISDKVKIDIIKNGALFNDSALFFSRNQFSSKEYSIKNIEYYTFYIPEKGKRSELEMNRNFKNAEYFKQQDFLEKFIIDNNIK